MNRSTPGLPVHHQLLEFTQTHVHWVGDAIQPSHPQSPLLLLLSNLLRIRVFSNELAFCIRWPKYWSFSFNISPSNEHPGLISFRMDWLDLLAVQGTLKCLLQNSYFYIVMYPPLVGFMGLEAWIANNMIDFISPSCTYFSYNATFMFFRWDLGSVLALLVPEPN